jgi:3-methyladenine DNA glycosylase AlkC
MVTDTKKHPSTWMNKKVVNKINIQISRKHRKKDTEIKNVWRKERMEEKK